MYSKAANTKAEFMEDLNDFWIVSKLDGPIVNFA